MPFSVPGGGGRGSGGGGARVVNLLQHDDLRKGVEVALNHREAGADWRFEGRDRDHIEVLQSLGLDGVAAGSGIDIALPNTIATPGGGARSWSLELTRGNDAVASQGTAAVQAHGDFYVPGSTTLGIRVTLAASEVEGAAGNAYRLDFQYGSSNLFSYNSITNEFTVIWTETSTVQQIVDALGLVTDRIVLSLIPGTDGTTVMGHGRTEAEVFGGQTTDGWNRHPHPVPRWSGRHSSRCGRHGRASLRRRVPARQHDAGLPGDSLDPLGSFVPTTVGAAGNSFRA